jgi:hypothetical protein
MAKIFEAWCDKCKWFTTHIEVKKTLYTIIKCTDCHTWTIINDLDSSVKAGQSRQCP